MPDTDIASAARRVAEDARHTGLSAPTVHLSAADAQAFLPVLDAVAAGQGDERRLERWQHELARMDGLGFNWPRYEALARAAMALADAERAARVAEGWAAYAEALRSYRIAAQDVGFACAALGDDALSVREARRDREAAALDAAVRRLAGMAESPPPA